MILEIIKSKGISHNSYFLGSDGEAAVIDPRRDVKIYLELAMEHDMNIRYIFETHRNEDYTIGSLELKKYVDAEILHGDKLDFKYGTSVIEGDIFELGSLELEILETPGHTYESISIITKDKNIPLLVFVGDVLFPGEVGRVDFFGKEKIPQTASLLYESLHEKILPLGDHVIVCPAHGAGSVCDAQIRDQDLTTIGYEKITNHILKLDKEAFIEYKRREELYTPPYFKRMEKNNLEGAPLENPHLEPLNVQEFNDMIKEGAQLVDVRNPTSFCGGHIPGSLNIWGDGFPAFAGYFLEYDNPIILVDERGSNDLVRRSLIRLGYDNKYGYLQGGFPTWYINGMECENFEAWTVDQLKSHIDEGGDFTILDVRKHSDREKYHIEGSMHCWVGDIPENLDNIPDNVVVYCDSGYKSTIAASLLKMNGYNVKTVLGGINAWTRKGYPIMKS
ncbi:MAG TPA: MBL fold metallo-hydrolase [Methanothermobacter sp.]|uniref:MBL fold hydrolase n=1 Tax=Methanothermobacter tenebrarum TaxID=680118 RepID=A0ABM7YCI4_9EURY|nr:rhodanese-like domain-containing protein [Methanothermobacter tenebrarum]MDX9693793.1 rhodanese-like domain-containing protein [Methanothermobacter sp.]BDH78937.1 MBL fold hydrolase [Methanothermobacter tenebrarum]HHW17143.1 MBL fold metallo-hydrolase [Methanothermobacter sp.]